MQNSITQNKRIYNSQQSQQGDQSYGWQKKVQSTTNTSVNLLMIRLPIRSLQIKKWWFWFVTEINSHSSSGIPPSMPPLKHVYDRSWIFSWLDQSKRLVFDLNESGLHGLWLGWIVILLRCWKEDLLLSIQQPATNTDILLDDAWCQHTPSLGFSHAGAASIKCLNEQIWFVIAVNGRVVHYK